MPHFPFSAIRAFFNKRPFWRNTAISAAVHLAIIAVLLVWSVASCVARRKPREITTFVDLQLALPPAPAPVPAPPVKALETAKPAPEKPKPAPKTKPQPPKKTPPKSTTNLPPKLTAEDIRRMLAGALPSDKPAAASATADAFDWYLIVVRNTFYEVWQQPSALTGRGLAARALIRVRRDGLIIERRLLASSGNALMDDSVRQALDGVTRLPPLPAGFGGDYKEITVDFELTD